MNFLAQQFYKKGGEEGWESVRSLTDGSCVSWELIPIEAPDLPRGWLELSRVTSIERKEFIADFWLDTLPYDPSSHQMVESFFSKVEDIDILLLEKEGDVVAKMVYSLSNNQTFFWGNVPVSLDAIQEESLGMRDSLPRDYLAFLSMHNGFGRLGSKGIFKIEELSLAKRRLQKALEEMHPPLCLEGKIVDPHSCIPFYEVEGTDAFQCFYLDWYGENGVGNVHCSLLDRWISPLPKEGEAKESLTFPSFSAWLWEYLEGAPLTGPSVGI